MHWSWLGATVESGDGSAARVQPSTRPTDDVAGLDSPPEWNQKDLDTSTQVGMHPHARGPYIKPLDTSATNTASQFYNGKDDGMKAQDAGRASTVKYWPDRRGIGENVTIGIDPIPDNPIGGIAHEANPRPEPPMLGMNPDIPDNGSNMASQQYASPFVAYTGGFVNG